MVANIHGSPRRGSGGFQRIADAFLARKGLPFAEILSAERIERVFAQHGCRFGLYGIYTVAITVWSFLSQVLRDGKEASCQAAVARVVSHCQQLGITAPTSDTGDYCRARAKLVESAIRTLSCEVAAGLELAANKAWLWKNRFHAKLIDGFTFTMPATSKNQARYPQSTAQKPGVGLPIARVVGILSLATACVMNLALGPYQGKETGEPALLRMLLRSFVPGDIAVADRYYCSFMMIALLLRQGVQTCARKHQLRHSDFRRGRRLGKYDHLITWTRPPRPKWMDEATYAQIPETLTLREIRYNIVESGRRTRTVDIITTLLDADEFTQQDIADLYGFRWNAELVIRSCRNRVPCYGPNCGEAAPEHRSATVTRHASAGEHRVAPYTEQEGNSTLMPQHETQEKRSRSAIGADTARRSYEGASPAASASWMIAARSDLARAEHRRSAPCLNRFDAHSLQTTVPFGAGTFPQAVRLM